MMPGGHLATSLALSAGAYAATGSTPLAAGCFAGGFLIDFDHYLDYLVFEKQWKRPAPADFLRYYFTGLPLKVVLPLHSVELMTVLAVLCFFFPYPLLSGYILGASMHLLLDILVNGDHVLRMPVLFYSFAYRASRRFVSADLMDPVTVAPNAGAHPWLDFFFRWLPRIQKTSNEKLEKDPVRVR
jgi:hypothetical protein